MTTQTLSIVDTLDDGYQSSGSAVDTTQIYFNGSDAATAFFSFLLTSAIGAGVTINNAYVRVYRLTDDSGTGAARVAIENANPASNTRPSASHLPSGMTLLTGANTPTTAWNSYRSEYVFGQSDPLPLDLTADMQSLVNTYGALGIGNRINLIFVPFSGSFYANAEDLTAAGGHSATLFIDWAGGAAATTLFAQSIF